MMNAQLEQEMTKALTAQEQNLLARAEPMYARAVGKQMTIRTSKTVTVTGTIVKAEFGFFDYKARSVGLVFKVTMECGVNKTLREFTVAKIPQ
jgi:hypothetical protein